MSARPAARPDLVDVLRGAVAARIAKRLDAGNPADGWTWADGSVATDSGETVTITGPAPIGPDQIRCSCLLSPRCLHVLAVAAALPVDAPPPAPPAAPRRPAAAAGLVEAVRAVVPARAQKRLEAGNPADGWAWTEGDAGWTVATGEDTVTIGTLGPVALEHLRCTCLLAPRCLHVLAVAAALGDRPADRSEGGLRPSSTPRDPLPPPVPAPAPPPEPRVALDRGQRSSAEAMARAARAVLYAGATGVGATARDDLQRAVHGARAVGLHRLGAAGKRVNRQVRDLQHARPEFALVDLVDDLRELLLVARELSAPEVGQSWVGAARRVYAPVGSLQLVGLCTEAVASLTGYGGVSTLLCDPAGRLWHVTDVRPDWTAAQKYDTPPELGGLVLPHRTLGRSGLFAQNATASPDGRVGSGGGVKAVRSGPSTWSDPGPTRLFSTPLAAQLDRAFAALAAPAGPGPWLFLRAVVLGAHEDALLVAVDGAAFPLRLVAPSDHARLRYRDNLRLLARGPGMPIRVVGRLVAGRRGEVEAVAVGPGEGDDGEAPRLALPADWGGRCNLGLDVLVPAHVERIGQETAAEPGEPERPDVLDPLRRRLARMALGGRGTLPGDARAAVEREAAALRARLLPGAAGVLLALADRAAAARTEGPDALATAWLAAAVYERAASAALLRASWA